MRTSIMVYWSMFTHRMRLFIAEIVWPVMFTLAMIIAETVWPVMFTLAMIALFPLSIFVALLVLARQEHRR